MPTEVISNNSFRPNSMSKEIEVNNTMLKPSKATEVSRNLETIDTDFRDFIKGDISMDELFKRKELENEKDK